MDMRISKSFLNVGNGASNDAAVFFAKSFDFTPKVVIQFDLFQLKKLGLNRPLTRVTLPSALRLA